MYLFISPREPLDILEIEKKSCEIVFLRNLFKLAFIRFHFLNHLLKNSIARLSFYYYIDRVI